MFRFGCSCSSHDKELASSSRHSDSVGWNVYPCGFKPGGQPFCSGRRWRFDHDRIRYPNADSVTGVFTAIGNVRIVYPARGIVATSRQAQYFSKEDRVVLTGDVDVIRDGKNSMQAERVVYLLEEEQAVADPSTGAQVFTSVQLDSNNQAEEPLAQ